MNLVPLFPSIPSSQTTSHRIPVPLVALPTPLATPPLVPLAVPDIPPLGSPLVLPPLEPPLLGAGIPLPLPTLPAGVRADGTLLYLLGGLDVVGGCSTKDVSVVRNVASTSGGAVWEGILWIVGEVEAMLRARAKDCCVGACRMEISFLSTMFGFEHLRCAAACVHVPRGNLRRKRSCSIRRGSRRSTR